jgi:hypothetical protein
MSTTIVAPTCPLPSCNLTEQDVQELRSQLDAFVAQFNSCFARADQHAWAHAYLQGLLSDLPRKSIKPRVGFWFVDTLATSLHRKQPLGL